MVQYDDIILSWRYLQKFFWITLHEINSDTNASCDKTFRFGSKTQFLCAIFHVRLLKNMTVSEGILQFLRCVPAPFALAELASAADSCEASFLLATRSQSPIRHIPDNMEKTN